jgi:hypothetical protein
MHSASRSRGVYVRSTLLLLCRKEGDRNNVIDRQTLQVGAVQLVLSSTQIKGGGEIKFPSHFYFAFA